MLRRRAAFRRKKANIREILPILLIFAMILLVTGVASYRLHVKSVRLEEKKQAILAEIEEQQAYTEELQYLKRYVKTKKYAEEVAKQKLGLVYSDEIVFKPEE